MVISWLLLHGLLAESSPMSSDGDEGLAEGATPTAAVSSLLEGQRCPTKEGAHLTLGGSESSLPGEALQPGWFGWVSFLTAHVPLVDLDISPDNQAGDERLSQNIGIKFERKR